MIFNMEPASEEQARLNLRERRKGFTDRRKVPTYISDDRRSGIDEKRKKNRD